MFAALNRKENVLQWILFQMMNFQEFHNFKIFHEKLNMDSGEFYEMFLDSGKVEGSPGSVLAQDRSLPIVKLT